MVSNRRAWVVLGAVVLAAFLSLGFFGREIYRQAPPIPSQVADEDGRVIMTRDDILDGQQVWQSIGGQQVGSIWGHGAYQAPDWSSDWLHREATALLSIWSEREHGVRASALTPESVAGLEHENCRSHCPNFG